MSRSSSSSSWANQISVRAQILSWELDPEIADWLFEFSPPADAEKLSARIDEDMQQSDGGK